MKCILVLISLVLVSCQSGERSYSQKICIDEQDRMTVAQYINDCVDKSRVSLQQTDMEDVIEECTASMSETSCPIYTITYKYDCNFINECDKSNIIYTKVK